MADNKMDAPEWPEQMEEQADKATSIPPRKRHTFDSGCPHCGALFPAGCDTCLICGGAKDDTPYEGIFPVPSDGEERPHLTPPDRTEVKALRSAPDRWRRWFGGVSLVIVLLLVTLGSLSVYRQYFDTGSFQGAAAVMYQNSEGVLMLSHPGLEQPLAVTGAIDPDADFSLGYVTSSPNGRWVACADGAGSLYRIDLAQEGADAVLVAEDHAGSAVFSQNNEYLLYINQAGELYASNISGRWRLDTGVAEILAADSQKVLYTRRGDREGQVDLYLNDMRQDGGDLWVVDRNIAEVLDWTSGFERILYTTWQTGDDGERTVNLHQYTLGDVGDSLAVTLVAGVGKVLDASAECGVAIYLAPQHQRWSYEHFVDDDMAARDASLREPNLEDYPLVAAAVARYGGGADFTDISDNEELVEENNRYQEAEQQWADKRSRDELRARLRESFAGLTEPVELGDLYVYRNGGANLLDSGVWENDDLTPGNGRVSAAQGYIAYEKIHPETLRKVKMSTLWEDDVAVMGDPVEYFLSGTRRELLFSRLEGEPERLFLRTEDNRFKQWRVAPNADGVYFTAGREGTDANTLYYTALSGASPADPVQVERDVRQLQVTLRDGVLFWVGPKGDTRLYIAQGASARELADTDMELAVVNSGSTLLYIERRDGANGTGDLYMLTGEQRLVAGAVSGYLYRSDELVYLLRPGQGRDVWDLYAWQDGRESLVGRDVQMLTGP